MDPLAEKYYSISPYAYCSGNPVNSIDPNGMDVYFLRSDGTMFLGLTTNEVNKVFSLDDNGRMNGKEITISDKDLLPQLANGITAETSNSGDAFTFFKFASDNSKPEWSLKGYTQEKSSMGFLLTRGEGTGNNDETNTVSGGDGSYSSNNLWFDLHSHPPGDKNRGPSGWLDPISGNTNYGGGDVPSMVQHLGMNEADKKDWYKNYTRHFIYHTGTKQLIFYNYFTVVNNNTQNTRGVSMGVVNSSILMRTMILNTSAIYQKKYNK